MRIYIVTHSDSRDYYVTNESFCGAFSTCSAAVGHVTNLRGKHAKLLEFSPLFGSPEWEEWGLSKPDMRFQISESDIDVPVDPFDKDVS